MKGVDYLILIWLAVVIITIIVEPMIMVERLTMAERNYHDLSLIE